MATVNASVVVRNPETFEVVVLHKGDEVPEWAEVGDHLTAEQPEATQEPALEPALADQGESKGDDSTPTEEWTNADIKAYADEHEIDLGGATTKADMLAVIGG